MCGVWTLLLVGLALTSFMPLAIAVFGLLLLAVGVAFLTCPTPTVVAGRSSRAAGSGSSIALP